MGFINISYLFLLFFILNLNYVISLNLIYLDFSGTSFFPIKEDLISQSFLVFEIILSHAQGCPKTFHSLDFTLETLQYLTGIFDSLTTIK